MELKVDFSGRSHFYTDEEKAVVLEVMDSSNGLTQGIYRDKFERKFAAYQSVSHAYTTMNATAALELTAQLCQFNGEEELIAPSHTFTASVYPFVKQGAKVVWVDIDFESRVVTADLIEEKITEKTKAILVVHLYGYLADMPAIRALADRYNLLLIEDTAQAIGTEINGKKAGSWGDFGIFSFHSHKNITTLGEGGMLTVKDNKFCELIPMLRHNGHCGFDYNRDNYWIPAMGNVDIVELNGTPVEVNNYCLGEVECALGAKLLDRLDQINDEKRARAINFIDILQGFPELQFQRIDSIRHNYHLLVATMENGNRDEFIRRMYEQKGVKCVVQYYPLHRYDYYKKLGLGEADVPNTDRFYDNMISFPFQHWMSDEELEYMTKSTLEILQELRG
ncbi:MAG: aminotransferase [Crocinitomicaceae bacterium]|nr:aminotransferase [Crocinitomicaceae bacterium]|tara:strand:- start:29940 stop:31118 length:1179 start_codon:yes stop_codon:yes gene_type:complete